MHRVQVKYGGMMWYGELIRRVKHPKLRQNLPLLIAYTLITNCYHSLDLQAPLQPLFTFLPVKVVGFRFAIQGDIAK